MNHIILHDPLIEAAWLMDHLDAANLVVLDASIPKAVKDVPEVENKVKIPGARFFDLRGPFSKTDAPYPNTMVDAISFEKAARAIGINADSAIVIYDIHGIYSSARAWWMFRAMGHENVAVLNGGMKSWSLAGYPTEKNDFSEAYKGNFEAGYQDGFFKDHKEVLKYIYDADTLVVDARATDRFKGLVEEPRKGLRSGHIPHSVNLPYTDLLDDQQRIDTKTIRNLVKERLPEGKSLVFSCGSGITACVLALAAEMAGEKRISVYDGSWTEWGSMPELPIEK